MAVGGTLSPIETVPGVEPITDSTKVSTRHYTNADKIRFCGGVPEKIGGWNTLPFDFGNTIAGTTRSYFSETIDGKYYNVLGTNEKLYALIGSRLTNITPLVTSATAAANSLETQYVTLGSDPLSAVDGSATVTVSTTEAGRLQAGDPVNISGATAFAGISAPSINGDTIVRSVDAGSNTFTINVGTNATSTASGGGASVVLASGLIELTDTAHGLENGDRVSVDNAATFGGVTGAQINNEFVIRNVTANTFDFLTAGTATSAASSGGGASTEYFVEISDGLLDEGVVTGYGAGFYGIGLYGTALQSASARAYPRIWFCDRYGNTIIGTPGNQTGVYQWNGATSVAPDLIANAPTAVNYAFVSNNILVTFGAGGVENRIFASDQGDITEWTSSSVNQVYDDDIEGAGRLISHIPVEGQNIIFTEHKCYTFRYIGSPFIWEISTLDDTTGIIAPNARISVKGVGFWMGINNFYMFRGGSVEVIPSNSGNEATIKNYVFEDINYGQKSKCYAWFNKSYNEVWFHYPSAASNECDRVAVVNILDYTWTIHNLDRTAAEYPSAKLRAPRLANVGILYQHESGNNACTEPLEFTLTTNRRYYSRDTLLLKAVIPDSLQSQDITFSAKGYLFPQSQTETYENAVTISPGTERQQIFSSARFYEYTWSGNALNQSWRLGNWFEELQKGAPE